MAENPESYENEYYSVVPTQLPLLCDHAISPELNRSYSIIEYLSRNEIIAWPNFTNCLPECGICTTFATDHTYMIYNLFIIGFLLPFISIFGIFGNGVSAFIYSRPAMRSSTNLYLCALGCSDTAVICTALIVFFVDSIRRYSLQLSIIYGVFASVAYPAGLIAQTCSVYFTLSAAIDCFVHICLPERIQRLFNRIWFIQLVCATVVLFSIGYNVPRFFENVAFECWHPTFETSIMEVCPTPLRFNDTYLYIYYYVLYSLFLAVGPLVVLVILNTCIIVASVFLKKGNSDDNVSLILVVLLFIACNSVALMLNIFEDSLQERLEWRFNYLVDISNLLVVLNSSFNFVIYHTFCKPFASAFQQYFMCAKPANVLNNRDAALSKAPLLTDSEQQNHTTIPPFNYTPPVDHQRPPMNKSHMDNNQNNSTEQDENHDNNHCDGCLEDGSMYCNAQNVTTNVRERSNPVARLFGLSGTEVII